MGCPVVSYMTVGTGIGVGLYCDGKLLHGLVHPEAGHMLVQRHPKDTYEGSCPFHKDSFLPGGCLEGYACGPAIQKRWGAPGETLHNRKEVWEMEAYYLGQGYRTWYSSIRRTGLSSAAASCTRKVSSRWCGRK